MISTEKREIDGDTYLITTLGAAEATRVSVKLAKVFGGGIATIVAKNNADNNDAVAGAIYDIVSAIDAETVEYLCDVFGRSTEYKKAGAVKSFKLDADQRNVIFSGRLDNMFRWLKACIEVNFTPLLNMIKEEIRRQ